PLCSVLRIAPFTFMRRNVLLGALSEWDCLRLGRAFKFVSGSTRRYRINFLRDLIDAKFLNAVAGLRQRHVTRRAKTHEPLLASNGETINPTLCIRASHLQIEARSEAIFARYLDRSDFALCPRAI